MGEEFFHYPLIMICNEAPAAAAKLPEGYRFQYYKNGMAEDWCRIQYQAGAFDSMKAAEALFEREFAPHQKLLKERMLFILPAETSEDPAGTASLWIGDDFGEKRDRLHWLAVAPSHQGKGLAKALVAELIACYREKGLGKGIYLTTQTESYKAINIYRQFAFEPSLAAIRKNAPEGQAFDEEQSRKAWQMTEKILSDYKASSK